MQKTVHSQKWPIQALQSPQGLLCPQGLRRSPCQQATSSQPSDVFVQMRRKVVLFQDSFQTPTLPGSRQSQCANLLWAWWWTEALWVLCCVNLWLSIPVARLRMMLGRWLRAWTAGGQTEAGDVLAICWHETPGVLLFWQIWRWEHLK